MERLTRNSYPGILCGIVILILTGLPGSLFPQVKPTLGLDKVAHVIMYAIFVFSCLFGYRDPFINNDRNHKRKSLLLASFISIVYGGMTEIIQEYLVTSRSGDWIDFIADIIGTGIGATIFHLIFGKTK